MVRLTLNGIEMATLTEKYKPYPAYRPSGVEWLGDVPAHWEVTAVKHKYAVQLGKMLQNNPISVDDVEVPYLKALNVQWFDVQTADPPTMWASQQEVNLFGIRKGDLLVCEGGEGGRSGIVEADVDGYIIQNALHRVRPSKDSRNDFLQYVLGAIMAVGWFDALNKKATIAHFTGEKFGALRIPLPPLFEQHAIAGFLDRETARIDALVAKKERLIKLLQEKRTALITRAVTRGLNPNATMKDSGVEWLGEIPDHWDAKRLKHIVSKIGSGKTPKGGAERYVTEGVMLLRSQNVHFGGLHLGDVAYIDADTDSEMSGSRVQEGDVLLNITGASLGRGCVARLGGTDANVNQHVCILRADKQRDDADYLAFSMESQALQDQIFNNENGVSRDAMNFEQIGDLVIARPPTQQQQAIAAFLDRETAKLDALIARIREAIDRLRELRTALISAAVTGRIDVRGEAE